MHNSTRLILAATLLLAAPAAAQEAGNLATTNDPAAVESAPVDPMDANATAPADSMTADPMAAPLPADPVATDMAYAEPAADRDEGRFPWGLLGLLGLAGLIPRKPRERADGR
ncbi:MAG: hypothetical protein H0V46_06725 [Sphingomonas sp.]|nr:hypothetical protein [Sphingomonas sp.]